MKKPKNPYSKKKLKPIILKIVYVIIMILIFYHVIFLINTTITRQKYLSVLGISIFCMDDKQMEPEINKNDLIITKNDNNFKENDIIAYHVNGNTRINKIINIKIDDGEIKYITKSNNNYYEDIEPICDKQIIGKVIANYRIIGILVKILQSKVTTFFIIIFFILKFLYNKYMFKKQRERRAKL